MPKRSQSSQRWLARQKRDGFTKAARRAGRVSRAYFKLAQMDERFSLVQAHHRVLELGAAPGGWTLYLTERVTQGRIIAVDPSPLSISSNRVAPIAARFGEAEANRRIEAALAESSHASTVDLVLSDMAPNISGVRATDQAAALALADLAAAAAAKWLAAGGGPGGQADAGRRLRCLGAIRQGLTSTNSPWLSRPLPAPGHAKPTRWPSGIDAPTLGQRRLGSVGLPIPTIESAFGFMGGDHLSDMGKNLLLWLVIAAVLLTVFNNFSVKPGPEQVSYSKFIELCALDEVQQVTIDGLVIVGTRKSGESFRVIRPDLYDQKLLDDLYNHRVEIVGKEPKSRAFGLSF